MKKKRIVEILDNTVALYLRFSSDNQRQESLDAQERACREYAAKKGLNVVRVYKDEAKSGLSAERKEFLQMIKDSEKKEFRYLLVHKLDRFSRDKYDTVTFKRKLKINGVSVLSVLENLDDSPESLILESVLEGMAQYYSINLAREVLKGMFESAYKATHLGGKPPLGFNVKKKKYEINQPEAQIVREIFSRYANGEGYIGILRYLNGMGFRTKRGNPFGKNSLYSILENEKYVGNFVFNKKLEKDVAGKRNPQLKPREEWIVVEDAIPAIIDKEIFAKVQAKMEANAGRGGRFKAKEIYLLSGLVFCGECGFSMYGNTRKCGRNKSRYSSYRCSNRANHKGCVNKELRKEYLENYVLDELYNCLFSDCSVKKLTGMLTEYNRNKTAESYEELNSANKKLEIVKQQISNVIQLVSESSVSIAIAKDDLKRLEEQKIFIEEEIRELERANGTAMITEETIIELISRSREFVQTRNIPECRNFIESYVGKVIIYGDKVEVQFKIHVPNDDNTISPLATEERIKVLQNGNGH